MTDDQLDRKVARLLREARAAETDAPSFGRVWTAARAARGAIPRTATPARRGPRMTAVAGLLIAIVAAVLFLLPRPAVDTGGLPESPPIEVLAVSLSRVETPLDSLLEVPGLELYATVPTLASASHELSPDLMEELEDS